MPNFGRWMSPDPMGGDITNLQSLNRYPYVVNNPTNLIDPLGLCGGPTTGFIDQNGVLQVHGSVDCGGSVGHDGEGGSPGGDPCIVDNQDQDPILFASLCPEEEASALLAAAGDPPQGIQGQHGCQGIPQADHISSTRNAIILL